MIVGVIYGLFDVRTDEIRYIGKTLIVPNTRLGQHRRDDGANWKARWIRSIGPQNVGIRILVEAPKDQLPQLEKEWIARLRAEGVRLTNITSGGEGGPGAKFGAENPMKRPEVAAKVLAHPRRRDALWKARISASRTGHRRTPESVEKTAAALRGVPKSEAPRAAVSAGQVARNARMTPEQRSEIVRKRYLWMTPEMRSAVARKGHETRRQRATT